MRYDCYLFDFDGTIADTGEGIRRSVAYSAESWATRCRTSRC